jgi:hypothetical protein
VAQSEHPKSKMRVDVRIRKIVGFEAFISEPEAVEDVTESPKSTPFIYGSLT